MDNTILAIIEDLASARIEQNYLGLASLDTFLKLLVPSVSDDTEGTLRQFKSLQDSFEYNIATLLLNVYKGLQTKLNRTQPTLPPEPERLDTPKTVVEEKLLQCNQLLQGLLLLHHPSRKLFSRSDNMNTLLYFLKPEPGVEVSIAVEISTVSTLIHVLLKNLSNFRTFEKCDGCSVVIQKLNLLALTDPASAGDGLKKDQQNLNFKLIEFLIFYLVDEKDVNFDYNTEPKLSVTAKTDLFRDLFPEIDSLVESLNDLKNI